MQKEKQEIVEQSSTLPPSLQQRFKDLESTIRTLIKGDSVNAWLRQQSAPVEVVLTTAMSALQGAALGGLMGVFTGDMRSALPTPSPGMGPQAAASFQQAQALSGGPLVQARNFAVMSGANSGISCALRRGRGGVEDIQTSMVAAFGSGAMFSLVSGVGGPNAASNAVMTGAFFAIIQGGMHKLGKLAQPSSDDQYYLNANSMLRNLGLERYQRNFKRGLLTDRTIPLLNDSALRDVKIPPGPRILILDYVRRNSQTGDQIL